MRHAKSHKSIQINVRSERSRKNDLHGGNVIHNFPVNGILSRMAEKVLHEKQTIKRKRTRENGFQERQLTNAQVREIRDKYCPRKITFKMLAEEYKITEGYVKDIVYFHARVLA